MANAFQEGRVGLWVNDAKAFYYPDGVTLGDRLKKIAAWNSGNITDVFIPRTSRVLDFNNIRATVRPDGTKLKAQLWEVPRTLTPAEFATQVDSDITRFAPGVVELDIEEGAGPTPVYGTDYANYVENALAEIRKVRPTFIFRLSIASSKATFMPVDRINADPNLYITEQCYYGDMSPVSTEHCFRDVQDARIDVSKYSPTYGAGGPVKLDGTRGITLPDILYRGQYVSKLNKGMIFSDGLMVDVGLL